MGRGTRRGQPGVGDSCLPHYSLLFKPCLGCEEVIAPGRDSYGLAPGRDWYGRAPGRDEDRYITGPPTRRTYKYTVYLRLGTPS